MHCRILQLINQRKLEELKTLWWDADRLDCPDSEDESDGLSVCVSFCLTVCNVYPAEYYN